MFFINNDLKGSTKQKNLREVIDDKSVKVAYGVLSLTNYFNMVKNNGSADKIYIPKVQRGLVWGIEDKNTFMENCVLGNDDGLLEPMPNIFLFCDSKTGEVQLFDGLQRTSAILRHFKDDSEITNDIMIPAALFKGTREEAEQLFKNINEKGVKLNDFEKLASRGGEYELDSSLFSSDLLTKFNDFLTITTKPYKDIGLHTSDNESTTLYELLVYAIYSFSKSADARNLFSIKDDSNEYVFDWGFQLAYSTTTPKEFKAYSSADMIKDLLGNFGVAVGYNKAIGSFDEVKLFEYISQMDKSIKNTESTLRDIYLRNIVSRNSEFKAKAAIKSAALVGSVVIMNFLENNKVNKDKIRTWYLKQLVSGRASSGTNKIVDELLEDINLSEDDINTSLKNSVINTVSNEPKTSQHMNFIWNLFYIQKDYLYNKGMTTQFEIDHIFPKSKLKKLYKAKKETQSINHIGNLAIVDREFNNSKSDKSIVELVKNGDVTEALLTKYYTFGNSDAFDNFYMDIKQMETAYEKFIKDPKNHRKIEDAKNKYENLVRSRASLIIEHINGELE